MTQVFISYSRKDVSFVKQLASDLEIAGLNVWYDLSGLEGGSRWNQEIEDAIGASQYFIVVLSPYSIVSTWVKEEILYARGLERKIVPLLYKPCVIPLGLNTLNYINVQGGNYQQNYQEILRALDIERSKREAAEKARRAARKAFWGKIFSNISTEFQRLLSGSSSILRYIGMIIIVAVLFWIGSWAVPKLIALVPTPQVALTATQLPVTKITSTSSPVAPTKTIRPSSTLTTTPAPTVITTEITDAKGVSMVLVPAGEFTMGSTSDGENPIHTVYLDDFYMDKYEVTNAFYKACVDAGGCTTPKLPTSYTRSSYYDNPQFDDYPVLYVNWNKAKKYCEWRGGSLPTEAQWEKAARGTDGRTYPWGEGIDCNKANYTSCGVGDTTKVGSYESGKSQYGIYDLAGNVSEWVADFYDPNYYASSPSSNPLGPKDGQDRVLRGSSWVRPEDELYTFFRSFSSPDLGYWLYGFRCVRSP